MQRCLATMNCPEYFAMVEHRLQQEEERACAVLDQATSKAKLLRLVDDVFVSQQVLRTPTSMLLALAAVHSGSNAVVFLVEFSSAHTCPTFAACDKAYPTACGVSFRLCLRHLLSKANLDLPSCILTRKVTSPNEQDHMPMCWISAVGDCPGDGRQRVCGAAEQ